MRLYIKQSKLSTTKAEEDNNEPVPKKQRYYSIWIVRATSRSYSLFYYNKSFLSSHFFESFLQLTTCSFTINTMQFTVSNNGTQWNLDFGPISVVLSIKNLNENLTISSLEIPLAACCLLVSDRQEFLDIHLPRVSISPDQQGTFEMREEVLSSVGAQDNNTRGCELSDLEDIDFSWEDPAVDMDSVYRPGIDTPFSPSIVYDFQMGSTAANPIIVDDEED